MMSPTAMYGTPWPSPPCTRANEKRTTLAMGKGGTRLKELTTNIIGSIVLTRLVLTILDKDNVIEQFDDKQSAV
jgi:hypothetical protein